MGASLFCSNLSQLVLLKVEKAIYQYHTVYELDSCDNTLWFEVSFRVLKCLINTCDHSLKVNIWFYFTI